MLQVRDLITLVSNLVVIAFVYGASAAGMKWCFDLYFWRSTWVGMVNGCRLSGFGIGIGLVGFGRCWKIDLVSGLNCSGLQGEALDSGRG